jgi:hypothetical protein
MFPLAEPVTWILPSVAAQVVGFETVPKAMVVLGLITTEVAFADELHPFTSVVTKYEPASEACAFGMIGF